MTHKLTRTAFALLMLVAMAAGALAADPGIDNPTASELSDQRKGSVLIYNLYTSSATGGNTNNTRINITNTNQTTSAFVHLFFTDGPSCGIADSYICLTANQTASFLASDIDPGTMGYLLAVAVNANGQPLAFNWLIGDCYVKMDSGHAANLGAIAVTSAGANIAPRAVVGGSAAVLVFDADDVRNPDSYRALPRVLAASSVGSRADNNDTLLVVNRIGGNYSTGAGGVGNVFGIFFDDAENALSYTYTQNVCQFKASFSNNFPRLAPRFETFIPAGRSGWTKFWSTSATDQRLTLDAGQPAINGLTDADPRSITGATINLNANATTAAGAFNGGHNLHILRLNPLTVAIIPVFPPAC